MREKALNLLGLMRRANAIRIGETDSGEAARGGKAKLLLLASDASDNARRRAESLVNGRRVRLLTLPFTKEELSDRLGVGGCSMAAVTDLGFADALMKILAQLQPDLYAEAAAETEQRLKKAVRRKKETEALKGNKRTGKRRTNG